MDAAAIDGKAAAWTRTQVLLHWIDDAGRAHNRWVPAEAVRRIARDDSAWKDPYDDWAFYYPAEHTLVGLSPAGHHSAEHQLARATDPVRAAA